MHKNNKSINLSSRISDGSLYLRDAIYWKDFKYLNPEDKRVEKDRLELRVKSFVGKRLLVLWIEEIFRGARQFLYEGSLHGVKYIFEPTFSCKEKLAWVVITAASVAACLINIMKLFSQWNSSPFVNVMDTLQTPVWAVPFPSVVVCPHLHVKLSYCNMSDLSEMDEFLASLVCPRMSKMKIAAKEQLTTDQIQQLQEFLVKAAPTCPDVVRRCYWRTIDDQEWLVKECCDRLFRPVLTRYGVCYAFNRLPLNGMTNVTLQWQKFFDKQAHSNNLIWSLDRGYPKVFPPDPLMRPYRAMASGELNGLGLELFLNTSEHQFACDGASLGYNILIASPMDHLYSSSILRLPMGRTTTIEVSPVTYKTDPELRSLSPGRRQCYFQDERTLEYYSVYTDSNCKHDMEIRETRKVCDCVLYNWPRRNNSEAICATKEDYKCLGEVLGKVEEQLIYAYYANSAPHAVESSLASCFPSCNDILYNSQVYYSDLKLDPGASVPGGEEPRENEMTRINVHFYDDLFIGLHRHAQYDVYYFAGAVGGILSLFLGFSIISVAELVYFVLLRPVHALCKDLCSTGGATR